MQFMRDLNNEELYEMLLESDQLYVRRTFDGLPELARSAGDNPDFFWRRQQAAIRARIAAAEKAAKWRLLARASALASVLVFAVLMRSDPQSAPSTSQPGQDQELLIAVERAVGSDLPASLEPAALLSNEIIASNQSPKTRSRSKSRQKENVNEKE